MIGTDYPNYLRLSCALVLPGAEAIRLVPADRSVWER